MSTSDNLNITNILYNFIQNEINTNLVTLLQSLAYKITSYNSMKEIGKSHTNNLSLLLCGEKILIGGSIKYEKAGFQPFCILTLYFFVNISFYFIQFFNLL